MNRYPVVPEAQSTLDHPLLFDFAFGVVRTIHMFVPHTVAGVTNRSSGPEILIANHRGPNDIRALIEANKQNGNRRTVMISKIEYWENKYVRPVFDTFNVIPVDREDFDRSTIDASVKVLRSGYPEDLGIYLEGGIKHGKHIEKAEGGAALLAMLTNRPMRPVGLAGDIHPTRLSIARTNSVFGNLIYPSDLDNTGLSKKAKRDELTERARVELDIAFCQARDMAR